MGRKDRNWLAGWLAASMGYVDKPLARVSWWCGWVSVSVSVSVAVFSFCFNEILFKLKIRAHLCMTLDFLLTDGVCPVPTYT